LAVKVKIAEWIFAKMFGQRFAKRKQLLQNKNAQERE
jgi:hypothetical protein